MMGNQNRSDASLDDFRPEVDLEGQKVPTWGDTEQLKDILALSTEELVRPVAYKGDARETYFRSLRDIHLMMRENYADMIYRVGRNIFPVIIATDNEPGFEGVGSCFILLLEDGSSKRIAPSPPEYEMYKNLSHMPLGLFTVVSPYFACPTASGWESGLRKFHEKVETALQIADLARIDESAAATGKAMLGLVSEYISDCLRKKSVDVEGYRAFTEKIFPHVQKSMSNAARIQVQAAYPALLEWKRELGDKWNDIYVVIPTVWPVAGKNPRQQIFEQLMDPRKAKTNIIMMEGAATQEDALTTLGRIVGDRTVGRFVFGTQTAASRSMVCALSTPRDVVSDACEDAIRTEVK